MSLWCGCLMGNMMFDCVFVFVAGIVVICGESEVLLICCGKLLYQGEWFILGGKIEYGEIILEVVLCELMEEIGIKVEIVGLIDVIDSIGQCEKGQLGDWYYFLVDYVVCWVFGELVVQDDVDEVVFFLFDEVLVLICWDKICDVIGCVIKMINVLQVL